MTINDFAFDQLIKFKYLHMCYLAISFFLIHPCSVYEKEWTKMYVDLELKMYKVHGINVPSADLGAQDVSIIIFWQISWGEEDMAT
jgi:hypothetical protein